MTSSAWSYRAALPFLACPSCRGQLDIIDAAGEDAVLGHVRADCRELYPVIAGVPRLVVGAARSIVADAHPAWFRKSLLSARVGSDWLARRPAGANELELVARFDREWRTFARVGTEEQAEIFRDYFDLAQDVLTPDAVVLDAGCGAGRWAYQAALRGARVIAVDLGASIDVAAKNTRALGGVVCVQGDLRHLPIKEGSVDVAYSLGVLHHIQETDLATEQLARSVRIGGTVVAYVYYSVDDRAAPFRALFAVVERVRRVTSVLPQPAVAVLATGIAALVYWPLARMSRLLRRIGMARVAAALPLTYYAARSFTTMRNDSLDRFGTALEKRYTRADVVSLLEGAGLRSVRISPRPPHWHATAVR